MSVLTSVGMTLQPQNHRLTHYVPSLLGVLMPPPPPPGSEMKIRITSKVLTIDPKYGSKLCDSHDQHGEATGEKVGEVENVETSLRKQNG